MEKITSLSDREQLRRLRLAVDESLGALGREIGLELKMGSGSYDPDGCRMSFKVEATIDGAPSKIAADWAQVAAHLGHGFTGKEVEEREEFHIGATRYRILGLKRRARKRPVIVQNVRDGTRYSYETDVVARALAAERKPAKAS